MQGENTQISTNSRLPKLVDSHWVAAEMGFRSPGAQAVKDVIARCKQHKLGKTGGRPRTRYESTEVLQRIDEYLNQLPHQEPTSAEEICRQARESLD